MTGKQWTYKVGDAELRIDSAVLSDRLQYRGGPAVDRIAEVGFRAADAALSDVRAQTFLGWKSWRNTPVGTGGWPLESTRLTDLSRTLEVPVALVTNDSIYALEQEVGTLDGRPQRPLLTAYLRMKSISGVTGVRTKVKNAAPDSFRKLANVASRKRKRVTK